jgi:cytochrome b561
MDTPKRYHPWLVTLHWLIALMVFGNLYVGLFVFHSRSTPASRMFYLGGHIAAGSLILILMVIRFFVRVKTPKPAQADSGSAFLDAIAVLVHYSLYVFVILITITGMLMALQANLFPSIFLHQGFPDLRAIFRSPLLMIHLLIAFVLSGLLLLHIGAALFHQFIRRDNLFGRMWFGRG